MKSKKQFPGPATRTFIAQRHLALGGEGERRNESLLPQTTRRVLGASAFFSMPSSWLRRARENPCSQLFAVESAKRVSVRSHRRPTRRAALDQLDPNHKSGASENMTENAQNKVPVI